MTKISPDKIIYPDKEKPKAVEITKEISEPKVEIPKVEEKIEVPIPISLEKKPIIRKKKDGRKNNKGRPKQVKEEIESVEINKFKIGRKEIIIFTIIVLVVLIWWKKDFIGKIFDTILLKVIERKERQIKEEIEKGK